MASTHEDRIARLEAQMLCAARGWHEWSEDPRVGNVSRTFGKDSTMYFAVRWTCASCGDVNETLFTLADVKAGKFEATRLASALEMLPPPPDGDALPE